MQAITDLIMYFQKGGLVMWPLLACSITVIAIAIERFIYYKSVDSGAVFASRYCAAVRSGDFAVATELARKGSGQCAQMLAEIISGGVDSDTARLLLEETGHRHSLSFATLRLGLLLFFTGIAAVLARVADFTILTLWLTAARQTLPTGAPTYI